MPLRKIEDHESSADGVARIEKNEKVLNLVIVDGARWAVTEPAGRKQPEKRPAAAKKTTRAQ